MMELLPAQPSPKQEAQHDPIPLPRLQRAYRKRPRDPHGADLAFEMFGEFGMSYETTGHLRFLVRDGVKVLQQQWGYRKNWAWSRLEWQDVPTVEETK